MIKHFEQVKRPERSHLTINEERKKERVRVQNEGKEKDSWQNGKSIKILEKNPEGLKAIYLMNVF